MYLKNAANKVWHHAKIPSIVRCTVILEIVKCEKIFTIESVKHSNRFSKINLLLAIYVCQTI